MLKIEDLIPQRYPFLFVDEILSASAEETVGIKTYTQDFLYCQEYLPGKKVIPPAILLESIIQCGGAGVTQLGIFERACWGLAGVDKFSLFDWVEPCADTKMIVKNIKVTHKVLKQTGSTFCNGKKVLEATWLCLRLP